MLKTILLTLLVIVLVVIAYIAWVVFSAVQSVPVKVVPEITINEKKFTVVATLLGSEDNYRITEIEFPLDFAEKLALSPPEGYSEEPYKLEDTSDPNSLESQSWVKETNNETIRWVGNTQIEVGSPTTLIFNFKQKVLGSGELRFTYEKKVGLGGSMKFFKVPVEIIEI